MNLRFKFGSEQKHELQQTENKTSVTVTLILSLGLFSTRYGINKSTGVSKQTIIYWFISQLTKKISEIISIGAGSSELPCFVLFDLTINQKIKQWEDVTFGSENGLVSNI